MKDKTLYETKLKDINFKAMPIYYRAKTVEEIIDKFKGSSVCEIDGIFYIKFISDLEKKTNKALKRVFSKYNEYWKVRDTKLRQFIEILSKYESNEWKPHKHKRWGR